MNKLQLLLICLFLLLGITNSTSYPADLILNLSLFIYVGLTGFDTSILRIIEVRLGKQFIIWPLIAVFLTTSWINSGKLRQYLTHEPLAETYRTDMDDYLKTYYLMEKGETYYTAHETATQLNAFKTGLSGNIWSWRWPTLFYVWKLLPGQNGIVIWYAFILLTSVTLIAVWQIGRAYFPRSLSHYAILGPYLLYPYLHFASRDPTLLQAEWWGASFYLIGLAYLAVSKSRWAFLLIGLAVLVRELFIIPVVLTALGLFILRKKEWQIFALIILLFIIGLYWHSQQIMLVYGFSQEFWTPRIHTLGKQILLVTFAFGAWEYMFYKLRIFMILYVVGLIALLREVIGGENQTLGWAFINFYIFPISFLFIGTSIYNDYWGIFSIPFVLASTPFILKHL